MKDSVRDSVTPLVQAPNLNVPHGFSTRQGGVSEGPYASFNLGLSSGEDEAPVMENRRRFLELFDAGRACGLSQVHSDTVVQARESYFDIEGDASMTDETDLLLLISTADCLPVLYHDPAKNVIAAAHCGWRGSLVGLAGKVVGAMQARYGSSPGDVQIAIGPAIRGPCYQVSADVAGRFLEAGFPQRTVTPDDEGKYRLDLIAANRFSLEQAGVPAAQVWDSGLCTHCHVERFYSYRRDRGVTGRHWAAISLAADQ